MWSLPESGTGTVGLLATLPRNPATIAYKSATNTLYYCNGGRLYAYNLTTSTEAALSWPTSTLSCVSYTLLYSASRDSLIFPYKQNKLYGVAEYDLSP